jgi:hypothetical protein
VRAVSVVSTGTVQIHPEHPFGTRKPLYWWMLTSRRWTPPRPVNVYVIEHAKGLVPSPRRSHRRDRRAESRFLAAAGIALAALVIAVVTIRVRREDLADAPESGWGAGRAQRSGLAILIFAGVYLYRWRRAQRKAVSAPGA